MNLVLLFNDDFINADQAILKDRRKDHIVAIHQAQVGDCLTVGLLNGKVGKAIIEAIDRDIVSLSVTLDSNPPPSLLLTLVVALPRPNMLKRILQTCATMGVKKIIFIGTSRVEKSFWQSPQLQPQKIEENLLLGLEQGKDTVMPEVILQPNFRQFITEELQGLCLNTQNFIAHPHNAIPCPRNTTEKTTLLIGPEGGFLEKEVSTFNELGFTNIHLGERILRVETAVSVLLGKLF